MKRQVLVYLANETSLDLGELRRIEGRIALFRTIGDDWVRSAADRVFADIDAFPRTTYRQIAELLRLVREHGVEADLDGVVVFDNEAARCGWFEAQRAGDELPRKEPFRELTARHRLLEDSPISSPAALRAALKAVAGLFDPARHEFLLVTRSHGTDQLAMTLALPGDTLDLASAGNPDSNRTFPTKTEMEAASSENPALFALGIYNLGVFYGIGGKGLVLGTPEMAEKEGIGITKEEYLDVVEEAGQLLGMQFSLVFMDSCGSEIPRELAREVPANIGILYGSTQEGLSYEVPDYARLGDSIDLKWTPMSRPLGPDFTLWFGTSPLLVD